MPKPGTSAAKLEIGSPAFGEGQPIPVKHTCDGEDLSPPLTLGRAPDGTKSLALICDDPDAPVGTWVHWVLYNLPAATTQLSEAVPLTDTIQGGARQGKNDFGRIGYGGPCPPRGPAHRYFFKLYALDAEVNLKPGATKDQLVTAMKDHILAEGALMATYRRR